MTRAEIVGENIRRLRKARGMTQTQFSDAIGRSQSIVAQYETGQRLPSARIIGQIAEVCGVTYDEVFSSDAEREANRQSEDWYGEFFGYESEPAKTSNIELTPEEVYLIKCYRDAEPTAQTYALQMLESNPAKKKAANK